MLKPFASNGVKFIEIALKNLSVAKATQRDESKAQIAAIKAVFDWEFFNVPVVIATGNGMYDVVDGQHGTGAAKELFEGDKKVLCRITTHKNYVAFIALNSNRRAITQNVKFWVSLGGGEPVCTAIQEVCNQFGIVLQRKGKPGLNATRAVAQLRYLWDAVGNTKADFRDAINILSTCFRRPDGDAIEEAALSALFIEGFVAFCKAKRYSLMDVGYALRKSKVSSADIVQYARLMAGSNSTRFLAVAEKLKMIVAKIAK